MELDTKHTPYSPSAKTDVLATFRRQNWTPPSELPAYQDKWSYYRNLTQLCEKALDESPR